MMTTYHSDYEELIGKYLNGYKIVKIEKDPFIKGQINLWTDEEKVGTFGDRSIIKFFIRDESNSAKVYQELVDKEKHELDQKYDKALEILSNFWPPYEQEDFMNKNTDYCSMNCGVDEKIFKKCWNKYIEQCLDEVE